MYKGLLVKLSEYLCNNTGMFNARPHECTSLRSSRTRTEMGKKRVVLVVLFP
uniref:Uncharacterized protein n=1 Tax=Periophthalmus magnuspinnatus TaxID=409849 RepID=A0A3B4AMI2_9GOBI